MWGEVARDDFGEVVDDGDGVCVGGYLGYEQARQERDAPCVVGDGFGVVGMVLGVWDDAQPSGTVQVEGAGEGFEVYLDGLGGGGGCCEPQALDDVRGMVESILGLF